ncbi:unnamed protein product [Malus baccata var. baccata]
MDVIHSLQLILGGSLSDKPVDDSKVIVKAPSVDDRIQRVDELRIVTNEMVRLIETAVVPIFAVDASGTINGWNTKAAELTGLAVEQAIGVEKKNIEIKLKTFGQQENNSFVILVVDSCCSRDIKEDVVGVVDDTDIEGIEECYMETNSSEFNLGETVEVVINQVMILSQEQQVKIIHDSPAEVSSMLLYGDNLRLQQVLSDFLTKALLFTPASEGSPIVFRVTPKKERIGMKMHIVLLEFHITHSAWGIPDDLIQDMFHSSHRVSKEGLGLQMSQNMVKIMNGTPVSVSVGPTIVQRLEDTNIFTGKLDQRRDATGMPLEEHARNILNLMLSMSLQHEIVLSVQYATTDLANGSYLVLHYKRWMESVLSFGYRMMSIFAVPAHSQLTSLLEHVRHMPVIDEYAAISAATNISES